MALHIMIEQLIHSGQLDYYVKKGGKGEGTPSKNVWRRDPKGKKKAHEKGEERATVKKPVIHVIYGGPEDGDSVGQRKQWERSLFVWSVREGPREKKKVEPITFMDDDLLAHGEGHCDSLVVTMDLQGTDVHRILVDTGSSVNILYKDVFDWIGLPRDRLRPVWTPL